MFIAKDCMAESELWNKVWKFSPNSKIEWECMDYSRTGKTIRFARLIETSDHKLKQINIYVSPNTQVFNV